MSKIMLRPSSKKLSPINQQNLAQKKDKTKKTPKMKLDNKIKSFNGLSKLFEAFLLFLCVGILFISFLLFELSIFKKYLSLSL